MGDCCSWYDDAFVDPSCLTSLILPPQFLFADSVKLTNAVSFKMLTKYVSSLCADHQKRLDRRFKSLKVAKYIKEYEEYLRDFEDALQLQMTTATLEGYDTNSSRNASSNNS